MHRPGKTAILVAALFAVAGVAAAQTPKAEAKQSFDIKGLTLDVKVPWLLGLSSGPEAFKCKDDKENFRTQECEATFEKKECKDLKIPVFPYLMPDCKSVYRPIEALPRDMQRMASIGGNRVKVIRFSFFEGRALKLVVLHEGLNKAEFWEGMINYYGPPSSKVTGSRDPYDDVEVWSRGDQTLKAGVAYLELTSAVMEAQRHQRFVDEVEAARARASAESKKRALEAKDKAKSDI